MLSILHYHLAHDFCDVPHHHVHFHFTILFIWRKFPNNINLTSLCIDTIIHTEGDITASGFAFDLPNTVDTFHFSDCVQRYRCQGRRSPGLAQRFYWRAHTKIHFVHFDFIVHRYI